MIVKIAPLGEVVREVNVEDRTTIAEALQIANVLVNGRTIRINNADATEMTQIVTENSVITLTNRQKGGL